VSLISFAIIDLPPGDYLSYWVSNMEASGMQVDDRLLDALRVRYGLDKPLYVRYLKWLAGMVRGDFGISFVYEKPVVELIGERMLLTIALLASTVLISWSMAFSIGIYSAVKQYTIGDYVATFIAFIGVAIPNFLLALLALYIIFRLTGEVMTGLFSEEYANAPWSWARLVDLIKHLWFPALIMGVGGAAGLIRTFRANLLDELHKPYVIAARSKGIPEMRLILRYPVRVALNPFVSGLAFLLPALVSGGVIVANIMGLPIAGQLLLKSLRAQDMYLAGSIILLLGALTVFGTLISDILLAWIDPRIRFQ
jgi:peptide/nickel transport system permease protein